MSVVNVVCCHVEVPTTVRSLVQGSPTQCACVRACVCVIECEQVQHSPSTRTMSR